MVGRRVAVVLAVLLAALGAGTLPAGAETPTEACQAGRQLVDVYYRYVDDQILNNEDRVVAISSGTGRFRLYEHGPGTFCALSFVAGTFTTFAGPSPAGTGTVPAGVRGHVVGESVLLFTGTFAPILPTRGYVGRFDANCDQFDCETPIRFGRYYVEVDGPPEVVAYRYVHTSRCGIWIETESSNEGDIAC